MNVTIVGAGIVGCAVAYELASRGARVRVVDPRGAGQGATRASAGVLAPYIEGHSAALLTLGSCGLGHYDSFVARVAAAAGQPVEYRRIGTLQVAVDEGEVPELSQAVQRLEHDHVPHSYLDGEAARRLEPALARSVCAALLIPQHGYVRASTFMSALVEASSRHGVTFSLTQVEHISRAGERIHVATSSGVVPSEVVVVAAGSWSGRLSMTPALPPPVRPIRGQLLHLRFPKAPIARIIWGARGYLVPWQDSSVLVGATSEDVGFDESATVEGVQGLVEHGTELVPAVRHGRFEDVRVGLRPATTDELPIVGASSTMPGVYYATGHFRNGVLLAPLTALMVADLVLDGRERPELALVRPDRFGL